RRRLTRVLRPLGAAFEGRTARGGNDEDDQCACPLSRHSRLFYGLWQRGLKASSFPVQLPAGLGVAAARSTEERQEDLAG
ncbi:hypothetical protein P7K49_014347, partial [Saguinus oedipus]